MSLHKIPYIHIYEEHPFTTETLHKTFTLLEEYCDSFSLMQAYWYNTNPILKNELLPYRTAQYQTTHWFCYDMLETEPLQVSLYPVCTQTKEILNRLFYPYHIYFDVDLRKTSIPDLEDLCFFKDGELVFGSVAHESIFYLYSEDEALIKAMLQIYPYWEKADEEFARRSKPEHIRLKDYQNCIIG
ncbi:MAG: hypothetical protein J6I50_05465 [Clostridia bacterium]|nr:hypothetical protein [Clostridia bacterium]